MFLGITRPFDLCQAALSVTILVNQLILMILLNMQTNHHFIIKLTNLIVKHTDKSTKRLILFLSLKFIIVIKGVVSDEGNN